MITVSERRCCMCPNINTPERKICPPGGPQQKKETACRFVKDFIDENGARVFVSWVDPLAVPSLKWFSIRRNNGKETHVRIKSLPIRETFDEAQADLNKYANKKGWKINETHII